MKDLFGCGRASRRNADESKEEKNEEINPGCRPLEAVSQFKKKY
jgi:hypothetical protein